MNNKIKIKLGGGITFLAVSLGFKFFMETLIKVSDWNDREEKMKKLKECVEAVNKCDELLNKIDKIKNTDSKQEEEVQ